MEILYNQRVVNNDNSVNGVNIVSVGNTESDANTVNGVNIVSDGNTEVMQIQ